jgi:hypothetical protein
MVQMAVGKKEHIDFCRGGAERLERRSKDRGRPLGRTRVDECVEAALHQIDRDVELDPFPPDVHSADSFVYSAVHGITPSKL